MSRRRHELADFEWSIIEPLLPRKSRGVPRVDDRKVLNGILWRLRTGSPRADIPERCYGARIPPATIALCDGARPGTGIVFWPRFPRARMATS